MHYWNIVSFLGYCGCLTLAGIGIYCSTHFIAVHSVIFMYIFSYKCVFMQSVNIIAADHGDIVHPTWPSLNGFLLGKNYYFFICVVDISNSQVRKTLKPLRKW